MHRACTRWGAREGRESESGHKLPSLTQKLSSTENFSQRNNQLSPRKSQSIQTALEGRFHGQQQIANQNKLTHSFGGFLSHNVLSVHFSKFYWSLHIYYGFWFCDLWNFCVCKDVCLCIYMCFLSFFLWLFVCLFVLSYPSLFGFVLFSLFYLYFQVPICFIIKERKKACGFGLEESWMEVQEGNYKQNVYMKNVLVKIMENKIYGNT